MKDFFTSRFATIKDFLSTQQFPTHDWKNIFSGHYWTNGPLASTSPYYAFGVGLTILVLVALEVWRRQLKRLNAVTPIYTVPLNHISNLFYFIAVLLPAYWFFRAQQMSYLSSRLLLGSILIIAILWLAAILFYLWRRISRTRQSYLEQERFFRYLPTNAPKRSAAPGRKGK